MTHRSTLIPIISGYWKRFLLAAMVTVLISFGLIAVLRLRPGLDFSGGSLIEVVFTTSLQGDVSRERVQSLAGDQIEVSRVDVNGARLSVRSSEMSPSEQEQFVKLLTEIYGEGKVERFETLGPAMGNELLIKTMVAVILALCGISLYLGYRFSSVSFGIAAALAAIHDALVVFAVFAILGKVWGVEVDTFFVTAVLTVLSFSVHDTIVVFDRVRERAGKMVNVPFGQIADIAVYETLNRSLRNSIAVIVVLSSMFAIGPATTKWFVFALLIGTIVGTYSSTFVALPLLVYWKHRKK